MWSLLLLAVTTNALGICDVPGGFTPIQNTSNRFYGWSCDQINHALGLTLKVAQCVERRPDPGIAIPDAFDWRTAQPNCSLPVRDQLQCGSCWAFATVRPLELRACLFGAPLAVHSPQFLLNCDHGCFDNAPTVCEGGCSGGYLDLAWNFLKTVGTVLDNCWPYTQDDGSACPTHCPVALRAVDRYTVKTAVNIQREILQYGPVTAGLVAYTDLLTYDGVGVYIRSSNDVVGGHAVTLVGWGTQGGVDYWIAENQWGTGWGAAGYLKIRRGVNEALIEQYIHTGRPNITGVVFPTGDIGPQGIDPLILQSEGARAFVTFVWVWVLVILL